ncbi:hypothetical protein F4781DRAFT_435060 [Annulohypoxylon bovei var. microspora]|nr:hypothetical protein F4781DRAFT_435060 [Annulohypoxylon bovei var. microspora]
MADTHGSLMAAVAVADRQLITSPRLRLAPRTPERRRPRKPRQLRRGKSRWRRYNLTTANVAGMLLLCGHESVVRDGSPFYDLELFSPDEWLGWEYAEDARYRYDVRCGNLLSGAVGFLWFDAAAELLMRETASEDLYVSFSHRTLPSAAFVAVGLFDNSVLGGEGAGTIDDTMPPDRVNPR